MKVLFDHQTFSIQSYGGISRYFDQLVNGINETSPHSADLGVWRSDNTYINKPVPAITAPFKGRGRLLYAINQQYCRRLIRQGKFDLLHATYYDPYFLNNLGKKPFVITIHDMIHERLHEQFPELKPDHFVVGKRQLAQAASAIITVSEFTRQDVIAMLAVDPARVHVVHHATSLASCLPATSGLPSESPYLLFVGNRGHYKNFSALLQAFALLTDLPSLNLYCAGGGPFSPAEHSQIAVLGLTNRVRQYPFKSDQTLAKLYAEASAFVFPSLYEGFGIPILEAFACGCPCVVSQSSSLPEVAQQAALYIDPTDPVNIAHVINELLSNPLLRSNLIQKGYERLRAFTWQNVVNQTLDVYNSVLNSQTKCLPDLTDVRG